MTGELHLATLGFSLFQKRENNAYLSWFVRSSATRFVFSRTTWKEVKIQELLNSASTNTAEHSRVVEVRWSMMSACFVETSDTIKSIVECNIETTYRITCQIGTQIRFNWSREQVHLKFTEGGNDSTRQGGRKGASLFELIRTSFWVFFRWLASTSEFDLEGNTSTSYVYLWIIECVILCGKSELGFKLNFSNSCLSDDHMLERGTTWTQLRAVNKRVPIREVKRDLDRWEYVTMCQDRLTTNSRIWNLRRVKFM